MGNLKHTDKFFICSCHNPDHVIHVSYWENKGDEPDEYYFSVNLNPYTRWYKRIWRALVWVFAPAKVEAGLCEILFLSNKAEELAEFLLQHKNESTS